MRVSPSTPQRPDPRPGDFAWLAVGGGPHPGVVIRVDSPTRRALVLYGTGTSRELEHRLVRPEGREGKALGLSKPTYFHITNLRLARYELLRLEAKRCPPGLFVELNALALKGLPLMTESQLLQGLPEVQAQSG